MFVCISFGYFYTPSIDSQSQFASHSDAELVRLRDAVRTRPLEPRAGVAWLSAYDFVDTFEAWAPRIRWSLLGYILLSLRTFIARARVFRSLY